MIFDEDMKLRYELACERISEIMSEGCSDSDFSDYLKKQVIFLNEIISLCKDPKSAATPDVNKKLYADISDGAYENSYTNPEFCVKAFKKYGKKVALSLNWIATNIRGAIRPAYANDKWEVLIRLELFLELYGFLPDADIDSLEGTLHELIYYYVHDYDECHINKSIKRLVVPAKDNDTDSKLVYDLIMNRDHSDPRYLYEYGEYVSDNEMKMQKFLSEMSEDELSSMAYTYTEGYRKGFEIAGIDLGEKRTVEIRYQLGFEPMVKMAVKQFEKLGLTPTFRTISSTSPDRQYGHDHRYDDALYLNQALVTERLKLYKKVFEEYKDDAYAYAGPAVIETYGEKQFVPVNKKEAPSYSSEQEKLSVSYRRDYAIMQDDYIPGDKRSYTIIAYPIPEIGDDFEEIFNETVRLNTLDASKYQKIQQAMIDALDTGSYVRILGSGDNKTDITVKLHDLTDPLHQTNFENCLADVNIPVGEVFTSPVLTGTNGVLHVSYVYLNGLRYENLKLTFTDGWVTDYSCSNYDDNEAGKAYIRENILHDHEKLPLGEFAIGTNTTAYVMGKHYGIEAKLPILIAEKTGPHFAVGDTCYSMSEDLKVYNPDGKEIIAKENECSMKRHEDPGKAYFQCHTDITIPYEELKSISVFTKEGKETIIIRDGLFVLEGTEGLNDPLIKA